MKVTVLGGGNWGTTVASLVARRHDAMIWARNSAVVEEINKDHRNSAYLAGFDLNPKLRATDDFEQAVRHALETPYVVQQKVRLPYEPFAGFENGKLHVIPRMLDTQQATALEAVDHDRPGTKILPK